MLAVGVHSTATCCSGQVGPEVVLWSPDCGQHHSPGSRTAHETLQLAFEHLNSLSLTACWWPPWGATGLFPSRVFCSQCLCAPSSESQRPLSERYGPSGLVNWTVGKKPSGLPQSTRRPSSPRLKQLSGNSHVKVQAGSLPDGPARCCSAWPLVLSCGLRPSRHPIVQQPTKRPLRASSLIILTPCNHLCLPLIGVKAEVQRD